MKTRTKTVLCCLTLILLAGYTVIAQKPPVNEQRTNANRLMKQGNFRDAFQIFSDLAKNGQNKGEQAGKDLQNGIQCLRSLGRINEVDDLRTAAIAAHETDWRFLQVAASSLMHGNHYGFIVAGKFYRGNKRGGGKYVSSFNRDRVEALQLMERARPLADADPDKQAASSFYLSYANLMMQGQNGSAAWRLQTLTDLDKLPDYEEANRGRYYYRRSAPRGAPVDEAGNPIYHHIPENLKASKSDGERWRWMLTHAMEIAPNRANDIQKQFANFLIGQFGVQTVGGHPILLKGQDLAEQQSDKNANPYALHTLKENETIARLASGVKRFTLPDEFNFIKILKDIAESGKHKQSESAYDQLAGLFENRRQYPRAAQFWKKGIQNYGPGTHLHRQLRLKQIEGNWGRFENSQMKPAGVNASVEFRYRNGTEVSFTAHAVKVELLLEDVKNYLKTRPRRLDYQRYNISNFGYRLVTKNEKKYLGEQVASWNVELSPAKNHFDKRSTVTTPLKNAGAYLVSAKMKNGNVSRIIVWITDTVIAQKNMSGKRMYFVADALTGKPVPKANLEFFGYRQEYLRASRSYKMHISNFAEFTDVNGVATPDPADLLQNYSWLVIARTEEGRFAYIGFDGVWYGKSRENIYNNNKVYLITDRPVYRPDQAVKFKFWVRQARYDHDQVSAFADKTFKVQVTDPKGKKILEKNFTADGYGGFDGELKLADDATLGNYNIQIAYNKALRVGGGGRFRVEEYKKPEFEVTVDAPDKPVMLGEKITAKINAKYYFGAPVTHAKVKYKITRKNHNQNWFPVARWDWFYGSGYWWFNSDYSWYPGYHQWRGCKRPHPPWWGVRSDPPEVVLEEEVEIGDDGQVKVEIDTALAKAVHGDQDHQYQITAEVVDQSRRTIVGSGSVLVAREPFKVFSWTHRGHYQSGDTVNASFKAQTLDNKPVKGKGELILYQVNYDKDGKLTEKELFKQALDTNERGEAAHKFIAAQSGQFRLAYSVTDERKHTIVGGYLFNVIGEGDNGSNYRFNDLELVLDKREYQPGDKVRVLVNTNRIGSTVLLFVRPHNGYYGKPIFLKMDGKNAVHEIAVVKKDMPNFFVEAITISGGKLHTQVREVVVPPEKRVANIEVNPSAEEYLPGAEASVKLKLTDHAGKPFVGSTVVAIYDKSVEYISGGTSIPEIRAFFWKWRRSHYPSTRTNLGRYFYNLLKQGERGMGNIGRFGYIASQEKLKKNDSLAEEKQAESEQRIGGADKRSLAKGAPGAPSPSNDAANRRKMRSGYGNENAKADRKDGDGGGQAAGAEQVEPAVRKNFADTALWVGAITTADDGTAEVSLKMPENLTTWKVRVWSMGHGTRVGQGEAEVVTAKNLIVRLQAPRFFVETDEVVLTANVHNYLEQAKQAQVTLELGGKTLTPLGSLTQSVNIPAGGEAKVDWRVKVAAEGEATITMKALTDEESDAMQMKFPVFVHGMLKTESYTGVVRPGSESGSLEINVPEQRKPDQSRLELRYSPSLAGAMVDALPYLVSYPHKTSDTTLHRFLPTVITQNILKRMNLNLKEIEKKRSNLNAQEIGDDIQRAKRWKIYKHNPVFNEDEVQRMVKRGLKDLTSMQQADGGWGWFYGYGSRSNAHTTALVVHGLQIAAKNNVAIVPNVIKRGEAWLKNYQDRQVTLLKNHAKWKEMTPEQRRKNKLRHKTSADNLDAFIYMVLADANLLDDAMNNFLYRDRTKLAVYAKALFGLALHKQNDNQKLKMIMQNIDQFLMQDDENDTAWLKLPGSYWWYWYGSEIEANAFYLKLLAKTDPKGEKAARLAKYIINNRRYGTHWRSTRDTAIAIEALAEFMQASGENVPDMTVVVSYDGQKMKEVKISAENLFSFDNRFVLTGRAVTAGKHKIDVKRTGKGRLYFNAYLTNFTQEDFITKAGLEIKVNRKFYQLTRNDQQELVSGSRGQAVKQRVEKYKRKEIPNLATIKAGDLVEVELEIDSKNDYEYLVFDDMKVAGFEPVSLRSGYNSNSMGAYMELRDERVTFFVRSLARGKHSVSYRLRSEIPGQYSALPAKAAGMYAPELKANSDEWKIKVQDQDLTQVKAVKVSEK